MRGEESPLPRLLDEIAQLNTKLHELSVLHYRHVVDAHESLSRCTFTGATLEVKVEQATGDSLPKLRERLTAFQDSGRKLLVQHKKTTSMIDLNTQLIDLLSIPQLMDTCVRSGGIEEALELCSFARTLKTRHEAISELKGATSGGGAEIVRRVALEVEASAIQLRKQLLNQLRGPVDLPTCLRLLSHMKRLDVNNVTAEGTLLQREFLDARDAFITSQSLLVTDLNDLPYETCLKQIRKNREIWYEVITQFQIVFGGANSSVLLGVWVRNKVSLFLRELRMKYVNQFENCGEIGTVYEVCSSFASKLAKVGCDFRPLIQQIFLSRVRGVMKQSWHSAGASVHEAFASGNFGMGQITSAETTLDELAPSPLYLQFPALVDFVNSLLRSLNDLRSFACLNVMLEFAQEWYAALLRGVEGLEAYHAGNPIKSRGEEEAKRFQVLLDLYGNRAMPYLCKCFATVFDWKKSIVALVDVAPLVDRVKRMLMVVATPPAPVQPLPVLVPLPAATAAEADAKINDV